MSAPSEAPRIPDDPVPKTTMQSTSVVLVWDPIPQDEANGELSYLIKITAIGQRAARRKRDVDTGERNTLEQCLEAAGITPEFTHTVPGNQTNLTLTNIGM